MVIFLDFTSSQSLADRKDQDSEGKFDIFSKRGFSALVRTFLGFPPDDGGTSKRQLQALRRNYKLAFSLDMPLLQLFPLKQGGTPVKLVPRAYLWSICAVEFPLFCHANTNKELNGGITTAFLDYLKSKYNFDQSFGDSLFDQEKLQSFDPTIVSFTIPTEDDINMTLSLLLKASKADDVELVDKVMEKIGAWTVPCKLPTNSPSSILAQPDPSPTSQDKSPPARSQDTTLSTEMGQRLTTSHDAESSQQRSNGSYSPGDSLCYSPSPSASPQWNVIFWQQQQQQQQYPPPGLLPIGSQKDSPYQLSDEGRRRQSDPDMSHLVEMARQASREFKSLKVQVEGLQGHMHQLSEGVQDKLQAIETEIVALKEKNYQNDGELSVDTQDISLPPPSMDPSREVVNDSATICAEYSVKRIHQYTRIRGKEQWSEWPSKGDLAIRFVRENEGGLVRIEFLDNDQRVFSAYLKYYRNPNDANNDKRAAHLFDAYLFEDGETAPPDHPIVIRSVKLGDDAKLVQYCFKLAFVRTADRGEVLEIGSSSFEP